MRDLLKSSGRPSRGGWFWFWAVALLVLPNCSLDTTIVAGPSNANRGTPPRTSAIFCDVEKPVGPTRRCATAADIAGGIRLADAAAALVAGRTSMAGLGLDDSPAARGRCGGQPEVVEFQGPFPEGSRVCLNCDVIGPAPAPHASNQEFCTALCLDLFAIDDGNVPPMPEAVAFCITTARAHVSTNFPTSGCFDSACTTMGGRDPAFFDPRRIPEPVVWTNLDGVFDFGGGTVTRTLAATGDYDAGASSSQLIAQVPTGGDAYLEFTATETSTARVAGLSSGAPPPGGISFADVGFGILLTETGELFVVENGSLISSFGAYPAGQKFRVKLRDRFDGTATVTYVRVNGPCTDGSPCSESVIHTSDNTATFPVRVDAMFRDLGATVTEARIVRIR